MRRHAGGGQGGLRPGGRQKGGPTEGLKDAFDADIVAEIEALVGRGAVDGLDFEAIETAAPRRVLQVAARAVERRLNADTRDHAGPTVPCPCGQAARYAGRRTKTVTSVLGALTLERAYYHCAVCARGFFPRDRALGLPNTSLSPAVTRMVGLAAAMVSFEESGELMRELAGVPVNTKQVERTAEALGREIAQDERAVVEPAGPSAPTLYLGLDGTGVPMRAAELAGRPGKQPDGSAKTREVKLVTVWTAEGCDDEGTPVRDAGSVTYSAAIESAATRDTDEAPSSSPSAWTARRGGAASIRLRAGPSWATAPPGSGTWPTSSSPGRSKSWTSSTPNRSSRTWPRTSTGRRAPSARSGPSSGTPSWTRARSRPS
jgi:hypothetical protein